MSALFPFTIAISRPAAVSGYGRQGYQGATSATETPVASGIAAAIANTRMGRANPAGLPDDVYRSDWLVSFRSSDFALMQEHDVVTDQIGRRFKVIAANPGSLGFNALCELMEP